MENDKEGKRERQRNERKNIHISTFSCHGCVAKRFLVPDDDLTDGATDQMVDVFIGNRFNACFSVLC